MTLTTLGIDPGTKSWDFFALDNDRIILDISLSTKKLLEDPNKAITIINSLNEKKKIDLIIKSNGLTCFYNGNRTLLNMQ